MLNKTSFNSVQKQFKQTEVSLLSSVSDVSLVIQNVKQTDSGRYICEMKMTKDDPSCKARKEIMVDVVRGNTYLPEYALDLCYNILLLQNHVPIHQLCYKII